MIPSRTITNASKYAARHLQTLARRSWLVGIGAVSVALDSTESGFEKLVERGAQIEAQQRKELADLRARITREYNELGQDLAEARSTAANKLADLLRQINLPSPRDLQMLDKRIAQLAEQLTDLNVEQESDEPFPGYAKLRADEVVKRLAGMDRQGLERVREYETAHNSRVTVLREIERLLAQESAVEAHT
ncbi:MAG: hypothetical protein KatS3mg057_1513 [Herpetosiphonaceae bacterium]|nr:MAG: hypothetical protein KatS3mg057_1513 [Herpetosiphonaceae bacterium]